MAEWPTYDYVLIGSGPTALAAIRKLPIDSQILVIDRGFGVPDEVKKAQSKFRSSMSSRSKNRGVNSKANFNEKSTFDVKTYWGSDFVYKDTKGDLPFESQSLGGFTKVWGATCFPASQRIFNGLNYQSQIDYSREISELEKYIDVSWTQQGADCYAPCSSTNKLLMERNSFYPNLGRSGKLAGTKGTLFWEQTRLAISMTSQSTSLAMQIGCINCGLCQSGCPYGLTWDSSHPMKQEINERGSHYVVGDVKMIYDSSEKVIVTFYQGAKERQVMGKRFLFTGGTLSTSKILIKSNIIMKDKIHDSQTVAVFGISLIGRSVPEDFSNVTFPEMSFLYQGKVYEVAIQLYSLNKYVAERINASLAKLIFKSEVVNWIIRRFFFIGLAYFDSNLSGHLIIDKTGLKAYQGDRKETKRIFSQVKALLRMKSLYLVPISRKFKVGGGYHFMGNSFPAETWSDEQHLLKQGFTKLTKLASLSSNSRIHLVDGSIQGFLPTGSVTLNSMAFTSIMVKRIVDFDYLER
jgi:ferredoxin